MTDAERRLWAQLRGRRLGGYKFKRQATVGPFVADFLCCEVGLIVEVDGGQHNEGADARRTQLLRGSGYRVVRFWNHDVLQNIDGVLQTLRDALESQGTRSRPSPPKAVALGPSSPASGRGSGGLA
jgi:very-short-patch-repair endonuclease